MDRNRYLAWTLIAAFLFSVSLQARANENPYDVLGKALTPLVDLLSQEPQREARALHLDMVVTAPGSGVEKQIEARLFLEMPDRLRIDASVDGQRISLCRRGQKVWVWPGSLARKYLDQIPAKKRQAKPMPNFVLPITGQQAAFLPALLQVSDRGMANVNGKSARHIAFSAIPEIAGNGAISNVKVAAWIDPQSYNLQRLDGNYQGWDLSLIIQKMSYHRRIKGAAWQPDAAMQSDILEIPASQLMPLLEEITK